MKETEAVDSCSAEVPDFSREEPSRWWEPGKRLLRSIRSYQYWSARRGPFALMMSKVSVLRHRFWSVMTASDIPINCQLGGGLFLPHPTGVVLHPLAEIGPNCLILQHVSILEGAKLVGHVDVGAGAVVLKPVTIGKHAKIGANAVVLTDVPAYATAVGVPARILLRPSSLDEEAGTNDVVA